MDYIDERGTTMGKLLKVLFAVVFAGIIVVFGAEPIIEPMHRLSNWVRKKRYEQKHGTPPGTYEVNMDDWN